MAKELFDIEDNEIRVVGATESKHEIPTTKWPKWLWLIIAFALIAAIFVFWAINRPNNTSSIYSVESVADTTQSVSYQSSTETKAYVVFSCDSVNDIALQIYTPVGGHAELLVGQLPDNDSNIILAAQAADYRADNGKIAGAFVFKGELLSRGHPKYGFCAIIGDTITMGMSQETALFERAVDQEGYFFRQFSLIHDGKLGESFPKGKAVRRALCYYKERVSIIETVERESMHDFTQALLDMGVQEAISLVGSISIPLYVDENGNRITNEVEHQEDVQENYIVWE